MLPGVSSEQATLYRKVSKAMYGIHHNKEDATALVNIAPLVVTEYLSGTFVSHIICKSVCTKYVGS